MQCRNKLYILNIILNTSVREVYHNQFYFYQIHFRAFRLDWYLYQKGEKGLGGGGQSLGACPLKSQVFLRPPFMPLPLNFFCGFPKYIIIFIDENIAKMKKQINDKKNPFVHSVM